MITMRPFTFEEAIKESGGISIDSTINDSISGVCSPVIFGDLSRRSMETKPGVNIKSWGIKNADIYNNIGVIKLPVYLPNETLCQSRYDLLKKYLTSDYLTRRYKASITVDSILNCSWGYDKRSGDFFSTSRPPEDLATGNIQSYLLGGEIIRMLLLEFDYNKEMIHEMRNLAGTLIRRVITQYTPYSPADVSLKSENIVITNEITPFHIMDNYYAKFDPGKKIDYMAYTDIFAPFAKVRDHAYTKFNNERLTYILQLVHDKNNYNNLVNTIQNFVIVLPIGARPPFMGGEHDLTKAYNAIVNEKMKYDNIVQQSAVQMQVVISAYNSIRDAVRYVNTNYMVKGAKKGGYRDIKTTLVGKEGKIRYDLQSTRFDYNGRTTIVVDPEMSIDSVGIPIVMLREMIEIFYVSRQKENEINAYARKSDEDKKKFVFSTIDMLIKNFESVRKDTKVDKLMKVLNDFCSQFMALLGRQPTLYPNGIQAYNIIPVLGNAIKISPLIVEAFNADFDGDQMHTGIMVGALCNMELVTKVNAMKNVFLPKDGECHIAPRHEMLYGLWLASKAEYNTGNIRINEARISSELRGEIISNVLNNNWSIYDGIQLSGRVISVGLAVIKSCMADKYCDAVVGVIPIKIDGSFSKGNSPSDNVTDQPCKRKWCKEILTAMYDSGGNDTRNFITTVNNWTKVGMTIAMHYPPNVTLTKVPDIRFMIEEFHSKTSELQLYYDTGFETYKSYMAAYSREYDTLINKVKKFIDKELGEDNGFILMKDSDARGNNSTVMQIFGMIGSVKKNQSEAFTAIVANSMARGLTGLEHMITEYGGRDGQIQKSIETATPGYISRVMGHTDNELTITNDDCGTTSGILLDFKFLTLLMDTQNIDPTIVLDKTRELFKEYTIGRYLVEFPSSMINNNNVESAFKLFVAELDHKTNEIIYKRGCHMRSPLTCADPCCKVCYGTVLRRHSRPDKGFAIGFEAATAVGEPGTQLTMNKFHSGGVASGADLTSSFDLMKQYLQLTDLNKDVLEGNPINTDVIATSDCYPSEAYIGQNVKQVTLYNKQGSVIKNGGPHTFYDKVAIKKEIKAGENICVIPRDINISEMLEVNGVDQAILYLTAKLHNIFKQNSVNVNIKHFETIVSAMIFYMCKVTTGSFHSGLYYTRKQYIQMEGYKSPDSFVKCVVGIKKVPEMSTNFLRSLFFENQGSALMTHITKSPHDDVTTPYVQLTLGRKVKLGE